MIHICKRSCLLLIFVVVLISCKKSKEAISKSIIDQKVDSVLSLMTLEEKIGQMNQYNGFWNVTGPSPKKGAAELKYKHLEAGLVGSMLNVRGVENVMAVQKIAVEKTRLGIPLIIGFDVIHGYKTLTPIPLAESASWDLEAIKASAKNAALEASAAGINWTFAPMVDVSRDARWGRVMEGAGEDPFLGSLIAKARIQGFQGDDLSDATTIVACAKHFAGYGFAEAGRDYNTVDIGTSTLHNIIFPPFMAATQAGVRTFMNSFNELNGIPATGNTFLQREVLKGAWGFDGFIVSDWDSAGEMVAHGYAENDKHAAELSVNAGSDMDMESYSFVTYLKELVDEGKVKESYVNDAARRILKVKFELGLFENPYKYCDLTREKEITGSAKLHEASLDMAKKSIVLLKNENQLLPLDKKGLNIAVIGDLANDKTSPLGSWRIAADDHTAISVIEGLAAYPNNKVTYEQGPKLAIGNPSFTQEVVVNTTDRSGILKAVKAAKNKDVVIIVLGEHGFQSGEARSRSELTLPGLQQELLEEVYKVNKNVVLVLMNGRPLAINWADKHIPSIVEAWQLGSQSGNAIAQVLYGDYNPSGKLPMTFPKSVGQVPIYYNYKNTGRPLKINPNDVFHSHYQDVSNAPLYEFGYGLSYTSFEYSGLKLSSETMDANSSIEVSVTVSNTGEYSGKEVVQLYIRDLFGSVTRPVKELKGFQMISLYPGESKLVNFSIDKKMLRFYTANNRWETEKGDFKVFVGGSSKTTLETGFSYKD